MAEIYSPGVVTYSHFMLPLSGLSSLVKHCTLLLVVHVILVRRVVGLYVCLFNK